MTTTSDPRVYASAWRSRGLVTLATLLCALLCAVAIDRPSYWLDESISVRIAAAPTPADVIDNVIRDERRPPAYHLGLWGWLTGTGGSERAGRLWSTLWAILLVPAVYQLTRAFASDRAAVWAALFAATSPVVIAYGQTVRYYTSVAALAALSYAAFFMLMRSRHRPWPAYLISTFLLLYSDYPAFGVPLAQAVIGLLWWNDRARAPQHPRRAWLLAQGALAITVLLWVPVVLTQGTRDFGAAELSNSLAGGALRLAYPAYAWLIGETLFPWSPAAVVGLVVAGLLCLLGLRNMRRPGARTAWLIAFAVPFALAQILLATAAADSPFVNAPARSMASFGLLCGLIGAGVMAVRRTAWRMAAVAAIAIAHGLGLANYYRGVEFINTVYNTPAREVAAYVAARASAGDAIVTEGDSMVSYYLPDALLSAHFDLDDRERLLDYIRQHPQAQVWQVELGRDRTRNDRAESLRQILQQGRSVVSTAGFGTQDALYRALKSRLFGREVYQDRLAVYELAPR